MDFAVGVTLDTLTSIASVVLIVVGFYLVYGLMRVVNMAHGDLMMMGAMCTSLVTQHGGGYWLGVLVATIVVAAVGLTAERLVIRHLYRRDSSMTLLATWGMSLVVIECVRLAFGPSGRFVDTPTDTILTLGAVPYPLYSLILVIAAAAVIGVLWLILYITPVGMRVRATMEDPKQAQFIGINVQLVYAITFTTGAALAGMAGALLAPRSAVTPQMGSELTLIAFLVVITGGVRSLLAPLAGSVLIGGVRSLLSSFFGVTTASIGMLVTVIVVLFLLPKGLVPEE